MPINGAPYTFRGGNITASQITDSTAAGRALLTAADATAQVTALGLDSVVSTVTNGNGVSGLFTAGDTNVEVSNGITISLST